VENAIWHGLMQSDEKGKLKIDVHQQEKNIIIAIEDNGIGREKAQALKLGQNQIQHQSFGIRITEERLELMKHSLNKNATFNIFDLKNKENKPIGTRVEIVYEV
jgi:LytS/YehU family sensor histidine kinase